MFDKFQNLAKFVFSSTVDGGGDYYGIYFVNILCVCDLSTYYTKSTLKYYQRMRQYQYCSSDHI